MSVVPGPHERRAQDAAPLLLIEEITHRVINEYTIAIRSIESEATQIADADARAVLGRATARLRAQADAHRALQPPAADGDLDLGEYLARLCATLSAASLADHGIRLLLFEDDIDLAPERCWRVGLIISELIVNAVRHGARARGGMIVVDLRRVGAEVCCGVADNGCAASDPGPSRGRGLIVRLAQDLGGDVCWRFQSEGVTAVLAFPEKEPFRP